MFGCFHKLRLKQCLITHRKHVKRRIDSIEFRRQFSGGKYGKLGDLYLRLGLTGDATQSDIKQAYYKLSKEFHPDRNKGCATSTAKFRSITEAYEILGNETGRAQYDRETPYARQRWRSQQRSQPSESFSEKDEDLAEMIRTYRANMRKKPKSSDTDEFTFRRNNVFDFDAWYQAHFNDTYDTKLRKERIKFYSEQYKKEMERLSERDIFNKRPPRRYVVDRKPLSDIEMQQMANMESETIKEIGNTLRFAFLCIFSVIIVMNIIEKRNSKTGPYQDPYAKKPPSQPD